PSAGDSASVAPALFSVPVRYTAAPAALKLPSPATVNDPPRFTVAPAAAIEPALTQLLPWTVNVWPTATVMAPLLTTESLPQYPPTVPLPPCTFTPAPTVRVTGALPLFPCAYRALAVLVPNVTVPTPARAWLPAWK